MLTRAAAAVLAVAFIPPAPVAQADTIRDRQQQIFSTLELPAAWQISKGGGATVGLVDSGADTGHRDLRDGVTSAPDLLDNYGDPRRRHGTAMASIIGGRGHGGSDGVLGVAPEAKIISIRALSEKGDPTYEDFIDNGDDSAIPEAIRYLVDQGADVINLSLGKYAVDARIRRALVYAVGHGVVVVAAAGNEGQTRKNAATGFAPYSYPASYPGVIGVAATGTDHGRASFSNRNYSVVVAAPGVDVPAASPGGGYRVVSGTSPATALVSGVAALIRARHPRLAPALVAQALIEGARHRPTARYGPDTGFGEVDALAALRAADRLAGTAPAGLAPDRRFGTGGWAPVQVVPRPAWFTAGFVLIAMASMVGLITSVVIAGMFHRARWGGDRQPDGSPAQQARPEQPGPVP